MSDQTKPVRVSRKCCAKCGERIRGSVFRFNKRTLCGLCMDDELQTLSLPINTKESELPTLGFSVVPDSPYPGFAIRHNAEKRIICVCLTLLDAKFIAHQLNKP